MMDRLFRIDFYPQEWLVQTGAMTIEQRGIFIQICAMIYANRGPIENDPAWIGRAANCSTRHARTLISQLAARDSIQFEGSKISQRRCERELNAKRTHLENSAKGGRNRHEKVDETIEHNNLDSSDTCASQHSPIATAYATAKEKNYRNGGANGKQSFSEAGFNYSAKDHSHLEVDGN
jgi:uncharacterized protein YdaU (DUF1376 family)